MPDSTHHSSHAERNLNFLKSFYREEQYDDWKITVSFYTAIHIVESAIFKQQKFTIQEKEMYFRGSEHARQILLDNGIIKTGDKTSLHWIRNKIVGYCFSGIETQYGELWAMSWEARYVKFAWEDKDVIFAVEHYLKDILKWSNATFQTSFDIEFPLKEKKK